METIRSQLESLTEDAQGNINYESWRFKLDLTLKSKKLFNAATGVELKRPNCEENM